MKLKRILSVLLVAMIIFAPALTPVSAGTGSVVHQCSDPVIGGVFNVVCGASNPNQWNNCTVSNVVFTQGPPPAPVGDGSVTYTLTCPVTENPPPPPQVSQAVKDAIAAGQLPFFDGQATWDYRDKGLTLARYETDSNGVHKAQYFCANTLDEYGYTDENGSFGSLSACPQPG